MIPRRISRDTGPHLQLLDAFCSHGRDMLRIMGLNVVFAVTFYLIFVYVVTWMAETGGQTRSRALDINSASMALLVILTPLFARLSDTWGRKRQILVGTTALALMAETFPARVRVTAVSVSYNLTFAVFGGTSPMVAVWLINRTHDDLSFAWYIVGAAVFSLLEALALTDRTNRPLDGDVPRPTGPA